MQEEFSPLSRLQCHCVFSEHSKRFESYLDSDKPSMTALKKAFEELQKLHRIHVTEHVPAMNRSFVEYAKLQSIMSPLANGHNNAVLKTSAWSAGTIDELRIPKPKKRSRKAAAERQKKRSKSTASKLGLSGNNNTKVVVEEDKKKRKKEKSPPPPPTPTKKIKIQKLVLKKAPY